MSNSPYHFRPTAYCIYCGIQNTTKNKKEICLGVFESAEWSEITRHCDMNWSAWYCGRCGDRIKHPKIVEMDGK